MFAPAFSQAYREMRGVHDDVERELLRALREHMVRSLFERCVVASPPRSRQRLVEQRRMVAPLAEVVRLPVYQGDYRSATPAELASSGVTPLTGPTWTEPLVFFDTALQRTFRDTQEGTGFVNTLEAQWVEKICRQWERDLRAAHVSELTVSILTFYRAQARKIRSRLGYPGYRGFSVLKFEMVDAIDRIQGQESDLVIFELLPGPSDPARSAGRAEPELRPVAAGPAALERSLHPRPPRARAGRARAHAEGPARSSGGTGVLPAPLRRLRPGRARHPLHPAAAAHRSAGARSARA